MMGKLRNKKTGEIVTIGQELGDDFDGVGLMLWVDHVEGSELDDHKTYGSIAELIENWEDYKPVEPLIKDEKVRKAVRAWAEANGLNYANCYESAHAWYLRAFNSREQGIDIEFWGYQLPKELKDCEEYTITELCGEEEE